MLTKSVLLSAICLIAATVVANAQLPYYQPWPAPQSWSYNPYTSGMAACPQWFPGDSTQCREQMPPSYGQPYYGPRTR